MLTVRQKKGQINQPLDENTNKYSSLGIKKLTVNIFLISTEQKLTDSHKIIKNSNVHRK